MAKLEIKILEKYKYNKYKIKDNKDRSPAEINILRQEHDKHK